MADIQCSHYKGSGYRYPMSDEDSLFICDTCNLVLASEIMKQITTEVFVNPKGSIYRTDKDEQKR